MDQREIQIKVRELNLARIEKEKELLGQIKDIQTQIRDLRNQTAQKIRSVKAGKLEESIGDSRDLMTEYTRLVGKRIG